MKNVFIALIAVVASACVSRTEFETLKRRNAQLESEDLAWRRKNAERARQTPQTPKTPSDSPTPPGAPGMGAMGGQVSTGAVWAYQKHGVYVGTVGEQPRQVTQGRKLKLDNQVCDRGSRNTWSNCVDVDENGTPDLNTWLAFEIDGQPVVCDSGFFHPESQVSLLPPGQVCHVEIGRSATVRLTIKAYRNNGTTTYVMLDSTPYATATKSVRVGGRNILRYAVGEDTL